MGKGRDMTPKTVTGALVFVCVLLGIGKTTLGQAPVWIGIGNTTCAEFLQYVAKDKAKIEDRFGLWVTGYLSGRNYTETVSKGTTRAIFGDESLVILASNVLMIFIATCWKEFQVACRMARARAICAASFTWPKVIRNGWIDTLKCVCAIPAMLCSTPSTKRQKTLSSFGKEILKETTVVFDGLNGLQNVNFVDRQFTWGNHLPVSERMARILVLSQVPDAVCVNVTKEVRAGYRRVDYAVWLKSVGWRRTGFKSKVWVFEGAHKRVRAS